MTIAPLEMPSLFVHTCTVRQATVSTDVYGHQALSWDTPTDTTYIPCRLTPKVQRELATGAVIYNYVLRLLVTAAPASLLVLGSEATHRIVNVRYADTSSGHAVAELLDAGPFDIVEAVNVVNAEHHMRLSLKRVG